MEELRKNLVANTLEWQKEYGVAPAILSAISEYDAAIKVVEMKEKEYSDYMQDKSAVNKGFDFEYNKKKYQIKATRPSGKGRCKVWKAMNKLKNTKFDYILWLNYDENYKLKEAYQYEREDFISRFENKSYISPTDMRKGKLLYKKQENNGGA